MSDEQREPALGRGQGGAAGHSWRVLVVNPGSTSTKLGLFEGETCVLQQNVAHGAERLAEFPTVSDQLPYRTGLVLDALAAHDVRLESIDAFVGRGGGLISMPGGTYAVNERLLADARRGANGVAHPAQLGSQIAHELAERAGGRPCFVVNPPDTDELSDLARMTGVAGVYRHVHLHALNLKETAIRHAASMGKRYEDCRFVVCHIGGGISVSAHDHGRMVDGNDIVGGEGPMAPTRSGSVPVAELLAWLDGEVDGAAHTTAEARALCMKTGGFVSQLGTSDALEVSRRAAGGDKAARRAWDAMAYQVCKWIGAMACALGGGADGILLGGGMVRNEALVDEIRRRCGWIASVTAYPGEFELEAMAAGACRVLGGSEEALAYTGKPVWDGFHDDVR